jgi:hypothetical protein
MPLVRRPTTGRPRTRPRAWLAGLLLLAVALLAGGPNAVSARPAAADQFTLVVGSVPTPPRPVAGADGLVHLAYEVHLLNPAPVPVRVDRVEAVRPGGVVLRVLQGRALAARLVHLGGGSGATLGPGRSGFVVMDVAVAGPAQVPGRLTHRLSISAAVPLPTTRYLTARTAVVDEPAVVVGAPLRGDRWVDLNGCCTTATTHRSALLPVNGQLFLAQRFAIDFVKLDARGRLVAGPVGQVSSWTGYGLPVVSATAGVVVRALDGLPDQVPLQPPVGINARTIGGNHVVVDIGGGRFAFYAHLRPGSVAVRVGDRVREGQPLGRLGNSGNSSAPHLHFHVTDRPGPLAAEGLPYRFRSFRSEGTLIGPPDLFTGGSAVIGPALRGPHHRRLSLNLQVVAFPTASG